MSLGRSYARRKRRPGCGNHHSPATFVCHDGPMQSMATVGYICNDILARSIKAGSDAAQFVPRQARVPLSTWSAFKLECAGDAADRTRRLQPSNGPPWTDPRVEVEALMRMALFAHITAPGTRYNKDGVGHAPALRQQWTCPPAAGSGHGAERRSNALGEDAEALPSRVQCPLPNHVRVWCHHRRTQR